MFRRNLVPVWIGIMLLSGMFLLGQDGWEPPPQGCVDVDEDGYDALDPTNCPQGEDCDDGNANVYPGAPELCDGVDNQCLGDPGHGEVDEDCTIIYVSSNDPAAEDTTTCGLGPSDTGSGNYPCLTINYGIQRAVETESTEVYVSDGIYLETVVLANGINVRGGFRSDTWEQHVATTLSLIKGSSAYADKKTVIADTIDSPTEFEGFLIEGQNSFDAGGNSYAIWIKDSNSDLVIKNNTIWAGLAGNGIAGNPGQDGEDGIPGAAGQDALDLNVAYGVVNHDCQETHHSYGGSGGALTCYGISTDGGDGGERRCPAWDDDTGETEPPEASEFGASGQNSGGAGGTAGWDVYQQAYGCLGYYSYGEVEGSNGEDGPNGTNGSAGTGCQEPYGLVVDGEWRSSPGSDAGDGSAGGGGGGGGSGAGAWVHASCFDPFLIDNIGATGGGGGSGGCEGSGGSEGAGGGGSFGVFVVFSSPSSSFPVIVENTIHGGKGGDGGDGGMGGLGGQGGSGAIGGAGSFPIPDPAYPSFDGGTGGDGGNGGHGGGGGGGCGGPTVGIYSWNIVGPADYCGSGHGNVILTGTGSAGGSGGYSLGQSGVSGADGIIGSCIER